ncbi:MAG: alpha/beta fold hydrolase, partial [Sandaracinobacteroides sp.]
TPEQVFVPVPGGRIFTLQWGRGPLLVFTHATGMCARIYLELLWPLGGRFRVVALDARGHGRTELAADPGVIPVDWEIYRADLVALVDALGGGPVLLAGHSFGATASFEAAVETPGLATAVCLIDPPFIPFLHAGAYRSVRSADSLPDNPMADQAMRRRGHFPDAGAVRAAYRGRGVFKGWPDSALEAYLEGALLPDGTGVRLACAPAWEATSFRGASTSFEGSLAACRLPFTIVAASNNSTLPAEEEAMIRSSHPQAKVVRISGTGHFLPITHPDAVRPYIAELA